MNFIEAVKSVLSQYAVFTGRARRSEYWFFILFYVLLNIVAVVIDTATQTPFAQIVVALALVVPNLAVGARRLHDIDRSGWWQLISLIPLVGTIILIVWFATDSKGDNRFGPNPKGAVGGVPDSVA